MRDVLAKISNSSISSAVARSYLRNGDFWAKPSGTFVIDSSWLPHVELAVDWYDRTIKEFLGTDAAELAYTHKLFALIGREVDRGRYGPKYDGAKGDFEKYMPQVLATFAAFEKAFPESSSLQAFRFQIAQLYWTKKNWGQTRTWLNKVLIAGDSTRSFYTETAKARLNKVEH